MKCHYEVLNVQRNSSDEDIKKSYRKLALKWHPDKNLDNPEEAKQEFQVIQQAYDCLSDPHERAWYDRHRESILRGASRQEKDEGLDVFPYFSCSCFKGFGADEKGFFTVYRKLFTELAEEESACLDPNDRENIPDFGFKDSDYKSVVDVFYSYWSSFCTVKSYGWEDKYDIREAPNRRVLRLMEKENKKCRDKAKKNRNEQIRELVSFIRRRDPRVLAYKQFLEKKAAENAMKTKEIQKRQLEERRQLVNSAKEEDWSKMANLESGLLEMEQELVEKFSDESSEESAEEVGDDPLFCIACQKRFKSEKALENHLNSKKHKESVAYLKASLLEEEKVFHPELFAADEASEVVKDNERKSKSKKKKRKQNQLKSAEENLSNESMGDNINKSAVGESETTEVLKVSSLHDPDCNSTETANPELNKDSDDEVDQGFLVEGTTNLHLSGDSDEPSSSTVQKPSIKLKGKKAKDARRKAREEACRKENDTNCGVCQEKFSSKNKLFDHLKKTGHAIPQGSGIKKHLKR